MSSAASTDYELGGDEHINNTQVNINIRDVNPKTFTFLDNNVKVKMTIRRV